MAKADKKIAPATTPDPGTGAQTGTPGAENQQPPAQPGEGDAPQGPGEQPPITPGEGEQGADNAPFIVTLGDGDPENNPLPSGPAVPPEAPTAPAAHTTASSLSVTSQVISSSATEVNPNEGLTQVRISYPEDYNGSRVFDEGATPYVAPDLAEQFVNLGIATIIDA